MKMNANSNSNSNNSNASANSNAIITDKDIKINDKREQPEFKGITFSTFQKSKVVAELISCILNSKIEPAFYWSAELISAGHFGDVWDVILLYLSKYIHLGNPKLPIYIAKRIEQFKMIVTNGYLENEIEMRNNSKIRNLFAEIIAVLCLSRKKHAFEPIRIKKVEEFNMAFMASRLKAPSVDFANSFFQKNDPKELFIAINEFAFHILFHPKTQRVRVTGLNGLLNTRRYVKVRRKCVFANHAHSQLSAKNIRKTLYGLYGMRY